MPVLALIRPCLHMCLLARASLDLVCVRRECGNILGVASRIAPPSKQQLQQAGSSSSGAPSAKSILEHVLRSVVNYKKLNQEPEPEPAAVAAMAAAAGAGGSGRQGGASAAASSSAGGAGDTGGADVYVVPGAAPLRHAIGAAGLGAGVAAGFHSDSHAPASKAER